MAAMVCHDDYGSVVIHSGLLHLAQEQIQHCEVGFYDIPVRAGFKDVEVLVIDMRLMRALKVDILEALFTAGGDRRIVFERIVKSEV